ncbi:Uncharacterised protein [Serratia quinivorans]|uniref:hypothetical protein n=1 Tax=Serratia quinivorans TaxID=137545 RepID=UPI00217A0371|nr:hypothetical protein [Serratia quinivorans]CAI1902869.1 Uncharacterised protein [Serratia quinivorans]
MTNFLIQRSNFSISNTDSIAYVLEKATAQSRLDVNRKGKDGQVHGDTLKQVLAHIKNSTQTELDHNESYKAMKNIESLRKILNEQGSKELPEKESMLTAIASELKTKTSNNNNNYGMAVLAKSELTDMKEARNNIRCIVETKDKINKLEKEIADSDSVSQNYDDLYSQCEDKLKELNLSLKENVTNHVQVSYNNVNMLASRNHSYFNPEDRDQRNILNKIEDLSVREQVISKLTSLSSKVEILTNLNRRILTTTEMAEKNGVLSNEKDVLQVLLSQGHLNPSGSDLARSGSMTSLESNNSSASYTDV